MTVFTGAWSKSDIDDNAPFDPVFSLSIKEVEAPVEVAYAIFDYGIDGANVGKREADGSILYFCLELNCDTSLVYTSKANYSSETFAFGKVRIGANNNTEIYGVKRSGFYALVLASVDSAATIKGTWEIRYPYGYLPYVLYPLHAVRLITM